MEKEIIDLIKKESENYLDLQVKVLLDLCKIPSGSKDKQGTEGVVDYLINIVRDLNVDIRKIEVDDGYVLIVCFNKGLGNKVILNAHMDTVFSKNDTLNSKTYLDNDYLYGLGASDCKGGIVVALFSLIIAYKNGLLKNREYELLLGGDEEIGSICSKDIYIKEAVDSKYALVFEPSRGNGGIIVSRRTCLTGTVTTFGLATHSSEYQKGVSAIIGLNNIITKINKLHDPHRNIYINIANLKSKGPLNQVCDLASFDFSLRIENEPQAEEFKQLILANSDPEIKGCKSEITFNKYEPPMLENEENNALYELAKEAGSYLDLDLEKIKAFGSSEASIFSNLGIATIDGLGAYTYGMHCKDEHTSISSILKQTRLALLLIQLIN